MKIYTKTGDDGSTGLIGGQRVGKSDPRIDAYGTIDELNATIGSCAVASGTDLLPQLRAVQNELFVVGSRLAMPDGPAPASVSVPTLTVGSIKRLEDQIDAADAELPPLSNFVLPGGCELSARLHLARTVCRRAERLLVSLASASAVDPQILIYINRLSDWLFVHARLANLRAGVGDVPWKKGTTDPIR